MNFLEKIDISKDIINVFTIDLRVLETYLPKLITYLSDEEKIQAHNFLFEYLKSRYIASHGFLRILLGKYLSCSPSQVEYTYTEFQKPLCKNNPNLHFNMSHSHEYACYAFSFNHEVGIDIEFMNPKIETNDLLSIVTTPEEMFIFDKLDQNDKFYAFYKTWTIKEAFLKALGIGLSHSLSNIETTILPRERFGVIRCDDIPEKELAKEWTFSPIISLSNYLGAIAVKKKEAHINMISLDSLKFL